MGDIAISVSIVAAIPLVILLVFVWALGRVWG